ncbi:uncharacterized protein YbaP (TraB family) [Sphingobium sp. B11D3B]|nr:uncharacterized protein YbaP (TraB family) [Sphingobium sp. B11D3B]
MSGPHPALNKRRLAPLLLLALASLTALLWLGWRIGALTQPDPATVTARPALWQASKGEARLWLFGTIHAVPRGEAWLSPAIAKAADESDRLYLEVTGLEGERKSRAVFERLGRRAGLPPIAARLSPEDAERYQALQASHGAALDQLDGYESWAAALLLNAAAASGLSLTAAEAGEAVLEQRFDKASRPVLGLETIDQQLGLFDRMPESEQRLLLSQSLTDAAQAPALYRSLFTAWASGDVARLEREFIAPFARAPALRARLIDGRNERWARHLDTAMTAKPGTAFVAVGAGHLVGDASLQTRLAARGWRIDRVQ